MFIHTHTPQSPEWSNAKIVILKLNQFKLWKFMWLIAEIKTLSVVCMKKYLFRKKIWILLWEYVKPMNIAIVGKGLKNLSDMKKRIEGYHDDYTTFTI